MKKFEYKTLVEGKISLEKLNDLGNKGWQICGIDTYNYPGPKYYFIREKIENEILSKNIIKNIMIFSMIVQSV